MDKAVVELVETLVKQLESKFDLKMVLVYGEATLSNLDQLDCIDVAVIVNELDEDYVQDKLEMMQVAAAVDSRIDLELIDKNSEDPIEFVDEILIRGQVVYPSR